MLNFDVGAVSLDAAGSIGLFDGMTNAERRHPEWTHVILMDSCDCSERWSLVGFALLGYLPDDTTVSMMDDDTT